MLETATATATKVKEHYSSVSSGNSYRSEAFVVDNDFRTLGDRTAYNKSQKHLLVDDSFNKELSRTIPFIAVDINYAVIYVGTKIREKIITPKKYEDYRFDKSPTAESVLEIISNLLLNDELSDKYNFQNKDEVDSFISGNTYLVKLLVDAHKIIREKFASEKLNLSLEVDPEEGSTELVLEIIVSDNQNAYNKLEDIENEWWISKVKESKNNLLITLGYE